MPEDPSPLARCAAEHPFAPFVRTLGRGRRGARALERAEARAAMGMILDGATRPEQTGAFLMLLRVKEETSEEIAGFVEAARARAILPAQALHADLDWPSYAGKRRQHPWYLLAALLLARHGHRVLMHGCEPHAPDRLFSADALAALGIPVARDWHEAGAALDTHRFAYAPLRLFCPAVQELLNLRAVLGLRSPANTFVRHLNPLGAKATMQSLQHPAYAALHAEATRLLGQPRSLIFRGEGGECELRPGADSRCILVEDGAGREILLPRLLAERPETETAPDPAALLALWQGRATDAHGEAAVIATASAGLLALGAATGTETALALARGYWDARGAWPGARA